MGLFRLYLLLIGLAAVSCSTAPEQVHKTRFEIVTDSLVRIESAMPGVEHSYLRVNPDSTIAIILRVNDSTDRAYVVASGFLAKKYRTVNGSLDGQALTFNDDGSLESSSQFRKGYRMGEFFVRDAEGDTASYYCFGDTGSVEAFFICHRDSATLEFSCIGNPVYRGPASDTIRSGETVYARFQFCNPQWALKMYELVEKRGDVWVQPPGLKYNNDFYNLMYELRPTGPGEHVYEFRYYLKDKRTGTEKVFARRSTLFVM